MSHLLQMYSIKDFHEFGKLPPSKHPMVSVVDYAKFKYPKGLQEIRWVQHYYSIGLKKNVKDTFNYGYQHYDFDSGVLSLVAPNQVLQVTINQNNKSESSGWMLLIHPDFFWGSSLATKIKKYAFFGYDINEALFLSEEEEQAIVTLFQNIQKEYQTNIDRYSQKIIISQIEVLLNYTERFYERQFITRNIMNHDVLQRLEKFLDTYFKESNVIEKGMPSVSDIAKILHLSPGYLSSLLKSLTGQSTQQHIQQKLIDIAKERLSTTHLTVSQIAYELGFEHPASFSKLFKNKVKLSPVAFRKAFR